MYKEEIKLNTNCWRPPIVFTAQYSTVQYQYRRSDQVICFSYFPQKKKKKKFTKRFFWPRSCSLCYCWDICQPSRLEYLLPAGKHKLITYRGIVFSKPAWFYVFSLPVSFYIIQITRINNGKHCKSTYSIVLYE